MTMLDWWDASAARLMPVNWASLHYHTAPYCPVCGGAMRSDLEWACCENWRCPFGFETPEKYHAHLQSWRQANGLPVHTRRYDVIHWVRGVEKALRLIEVRTALPRPARG